MTTRVSFFSWHSPLQQEDRYTCTAMMPAAVSAVWQLALVLLQEALGRFPWGVTEMSYSSAMATGEKASAWQTSLRLFHELEARRLETGLVAWRLLLLSLLFIFGCFRRRFPNAPCRRWFLIACQVPHNVAISSCEKGLRWREALRLLAVAQGLEPSAISYAAAMSACLNAGQTSRAMWLLRDFESKQLPSTDVWCSTALMVCRRL